MQDCCSFRTFEHIQYRVHVQYILHLMPSFPMDVVHIHTSNIPAHSIRYTLYVGDPRLQSEHQPTWARSDRNECMYNLSLGGMSTKAFSMETLSDLQPIKTAWDRRWVFRQIIGDESRPSLPSSNCNRTGTCSAPSLNLIEIAEWSGVEPSEEKAKWGRYCRGDELLESIRVLQ